MIVRLATRKDLIKAEDFYKDYGDSSFPFFRIGKQIANLIDNNSAIVVEYNGELIGGMAGYISKTITGEESVYMVMFFYVVRRFRRKIRRILKAIMAFLKGKVQQIIIASPYTEDSAKRDRFYKIMGFKPLETHFVRSLNG